MHSEFALHSRFQISIQHELHYCKDWLAPDHFNYLWNRVNFVNYLVLTPRSLTTFL